MSIKGQGNPIHFQIQSITVNISGQFHSYHVGVGVKSINVEDEAILIVNDDDTVKVFNGYPFEIEGKIEG